MPKDETVEAKMTKAIGVWAKKKPVRTVDFQKAMGWSYNYAWRVLHERDAFTPSAYGQFIQAYGLNELKEIFRIAGLDPSGVREDK